MKYVVSTGSFHVYGHGGYKFDLGWTRSEAEAQLETLQDLSWIDGASRAVVVEIASYNVDVNVMSVVTCIVEFPFTGGAAPFGYVHSIRPYR